MLQVVQLAIWSGGAAYARQQLGSAGHVALIVLVPLILFFFEYHAATPHRSGIASRRNSLGALLLITSGMYGR
jgi:hypothetical protein